MNVRATRFPLFDSLRAIAAIAVLATHAGAIAGLYTGHSSLGRYVSRLDVGVPVFFLISGFLLYRPFVRARLHGDPQPETPAYAWRRFLRIVPAYWVALTVVALWLPLHGVFTLGGLRYYGYAQIYSVHTFAGGIVQAWTLCVEVSFYAFIPLWALAMRRVGRGWRGGLRAETLSLALLFCFSIVWKVVVLAGGNPKLVHLTPALVVLPAYLDQFALGMALAVLSVWLERRDALPRALSPIDRFPALCWAAALVAFWAVTTQIGTTGRFFEPYSDTQYMKRHLLYAMVALGVLLPAVIGNQRRGGVRWILGHRALLYLGVISYGIYLYGGATTSKGIDLILSLVGPIPSAHVRFVVTFAIGLIGAVAIASISWFALERPLLKLKHRVGSREPDPGEALAEPASVSAPTARAG